MNHKCNIPSTPQALSWVYEVCYVHDFTWGTKFHKPLNASGQIIMFHQPRFPWNNGISLPQLPFGLRSCEVAIIWPNAYVCLPCHPCLFPPETLASSCKCTWILLGYLENLWTDSVTWKRTLQWFACGTLKWWIRNQSQIHKTYQQQKIALCLIFFWVIFQSICL